MRITIQNAVNNFNVKHDSSIIIDVCKFGYATESHSPFDTTADYSDLMQGKDGNLYAKDSSCGSGMSSNLYSPVFDILFKNKDEEVEASFFECENLEEIVLDFLEENFN